MSKHCGDVFCRSLLKGNCTFCANLATTTFAMGANLYKFDICNRFGQTLCKFDLSSSGCRFCQLAASCQQVAASLLNSSSYNKSVKTYCNFVFADLLQAIETTSFIKLVDKKS